MKSFKSPSLPVFSFLVLSLLSLSAPSDARAQIFPPGPTLDAVRIISPVNRAVFRAPVDIPLFAYAHGTPGTISFTNFFISTVTNVEFFAGTTDLGKGARLGGPLRTNAPNPLVTDEYSLVWSNVPVGTYVLTARAATEKGRTLTSAPVNITVLGPPPIVTNRPDFVSVIASSPVAIEGTNCWIWPGLTNTSPSWTNWTGGRLVYFTNCGPQNAVFTLRRFGDASADLTVNYRLGGTASNGVDYVALPGTVTIPAGSSYATVTVVPLDDGPPETNRTVILSLTADANTTVDYVPRFPLSAAAVIIDGSATRPHAGFLPGRNFQFSASGPDGAWYSVQYTTNLASWVSICTNQVLNGSIDFVDPDASVEAGRFYRVIPQAGPPSQ